MFRSTSRSLLAWWADFSDDILGADLGDRASDEFAAEDATEQTGTVGAPVFELEYHRGHPHRVPLTRRRLHRPGQVPERPSFCLSPVRSASTREGGTRRDLGQIAR